MYSVTVHLQELGLIVAAEVNSGIGERGLMSSGSIHS